MKQQTIKIILFTIAIAFLMVSIPYTENVKASSIVYPVGFNVDEGGGSGFQFPIAPKTSILNTAKKSGNFEVNTACKRTGENGFYGQGSGFFNFSYESSNYLTSFKSFIYPTQVGDVHTTTWFFYFYNKTIASGVDITTKLGTSANLKKYIIAGVEIYQYKTSGSPHYTYEILHIKSDGTWSTALNNELGTTGWDYFGFDIINSYGYCNYYLSYDGVSVGYWWNDTVCNTTAILNNERIDSCYIYGDTEAYCYIDDVNITVSNSYTYEEESGGCIDTDNYEYFSRNIEIMDGYIDYNTPFIEFTSGAELTLTPEVFELWVGSALINYDSDSDNYRLYINGLNIGVAQCIYFLSGQTYVIQWDLSSLSSFDSDTLIFEVYHGSKFDGNNYWNVARSTPNLFEGPPSPTFIIYKNTATNGVLDGTHDYHGACWKLFYSSFGSGESGENDDFTVGINLIEFQNTHPLWNIPFSYNLKTVWFEVFSNRTDGFYYLNISDDDTSLDVGQTQNFPRTIYAYHNIIGWTPYAESNYTVRLCKISDDTISDSKTFNITETDTDYAIWTFPNPSNYGGQHGVGVYIADETDFNVYYVVGSSTIEHSLDFTDASISIKVGSLDLNKFWSTSVRTFMTGSSEYWRIWGTNDNESFIPLTSTYEHFVNSVNQYNYIQTSLDNNEGIKDEEFNVFGQHSYILSQLAVYQNNNPILDVSGDYSFMIPVTITQKGTYVFSLRIFNDGAWEVIDSVTVTIYTPEEYQGTSYKIEPPVSYIIGAVIVVIFIMIPILLTSKSDVNGSVVQFASFIMAIIGLVIDTLLGLFPVWVLGAVIVIGALIIAILWLKGGNSE